MFCVEVCWFIFERKKEAGDGRKEKGKSKKQKAKGGKPKTGWPKRSFRCSVFHREP